MEELKAGVILKTRFVDKLMNNKDSAQRFQDYIEYIDREEAVRNDNFHKFSLYNDYMGNPEKTNGLFTEQKENLNNEEKQQLKHLFQKAYDSDSLLWQTIVSFDNRFLEEQGLYNSRSQKVDDEKLRAYTRKMMQTMLKKEGMEDSALWSASIHFNTDNIHIHIATVEPIPMRQKVNINGKQRRKGFFKGDTIRSMKSTMVNQILAQDRSLMNELLRTKIVGGTKNKLESPSLLYDKQLRQQFLRIYKKLPKDKRKWMYNMNALHDVRGDIDKLSRYFLKESFPKEYEEFLQLLQKQQKTFQTAYGEKSQYSNFTQTKVDELYQKMGNAILKQIKEYDKQQTMTKKTLESLFKKEWKPPDHALEQHLNQLKRSLGGTFDKQKKLSYQAYAQLQYELAQK